MRRIETNPSLGQPECFVIYEDKALRGNVLVTSHKGVAVIWFIFVKPKHRRKGYAKEMVEYVQTLFPVVVTEYGVTPKPSRNLLERLGFKKDGNLLVWKSPSVIASSTPPEQSES